MQIKLNDLDTRLTRIERVVANNSLLDISNQMGALQADLRSMHNDIDELNHALDTSRKQQRDLYADLDQRLKALESRPGSLGCRAGSASAGAGGPAAGPPGSTVLRRARRAARARRPVRARRRVRRRRAGRVPPIP